MPFHKMDQCFRDGHYGELLPLALASAHYYESRYPNKSLLYFTYWVTGNFYQKNKLYGEALASFQKAEQLGVPYQDPAATPYLRNDIALVYYELKNYNKALAYYLTLDLQSKLFEDNIALKASIYNNIARCYENMNLPNYKKSQDNYTKSLGYYTSLKDSLHIATVLLNLGDLYFEDYRDELAITHFKKALELAKKIKAVDILDDIYFNLSLALEAKGNSQEALIYYKAYVAIQETIWNRDRLWKLAEQEKKFAVGKKETEIKLLENEAKLQKALLQAKKTGQNIYLAVSLALLILLLISIRAYRQRTRKNTVIALQNEKLDELNQTKDRLFSIVAHDLRSPVYLLKESNLKLQQALHDEDYLSFQTLLQANAAITETTYAMLDNLLYWAIEQNKKLLFTREALLLTRIVEQVCDNYLPIIASKELAFSMDIPTGLQVYADGNALKIILRNVLDNAIKFTEKGGIIRLDAYEKEEGPQLRLKDNGMGMDKEVLQSLFHQDSTLRQKDTHGRTGTGLGLELSKIMAEKNGGTLFIESKVKEGTTVFITLAAVKIDKHVKNKSTYTGG